MNRSHRRLILFARHPEEGLVKTRLIPTLGAQGATALHRRMVLHTLRTARAACRQSDADLEIRFAGGTEDAIRHWLGAGDAVRCRPQSGADLGQRMAAAFADSFREGASSTVVIGSDCPGLTPEIVAMAFDRLRENQAVFGPAEDGGYYLVGLRQPGQAELFREIPWGTGTVLADSLAVAKRMEIACALLPPLPDVDNPRDLIHWRRIADPEENERGRISVIIPTLNEGASIGDTLASVKAGGPHEIIVVDAGSSDDTASQASAGGATVLRAPAGRARQMNAGAAQAGGNVLLFLHADTLLPGQWPAIVERLLQSRAVAAGAFSLSIQGAFAGRVLVERLANLRSRWCQQPFGDQGLFLRRSLFEELGGFANLPVLEDYELNRRLQRRGKIVTAPERVLTSGRRWETLGVLRTTLTNQVMIAGYHLGVNPKRLAALYRGKTKGS